MNKKHMKFFCLFFCILLYCFMEYSFSPIFNSSTLIFPYAINPFDIVNRYPSAWNYIKTAYRITFIISNYVLSNLIFNSIFFNLKIPKRKSKIIVSNAFSSKINLLLGKISSTGEKIYIPEKALYQNILITGTIGSRQN